MPLLKKGDTVALTVCSNGKQVEYRNQMKELHEVLEDMGLKVIDSPYIFAKEGSASSGTGKQKAEILMGFYENKEVKAIFDVSGGDLGNEVLPWLDFEKIRTNPKPFFGYSDLTVVLNSILSQTGQRAFLYQINNLIWERGTAQKERFVKSLMEDAIDLFGITTYFIQGKHIEGEVIGGNIRCFLKLAGTPYFPDMKDKILFLESNSGNVESLTSYLIQMKMMGIFDQVKGILLGTFTEMERRRLQPPVEDIIRDVVDNPNLTIVKTREIGHGTDSKCLIIGGRYKID